MCIKHVAYKKRKSLLRLVCIFRPRLDETSIDSDALFKNLKASLILIDFGVSIDMSLLPENTKFHFKFEKEENLTPEMKENKPWNYQVKIPNEGELWLTDKNEFNQNIWYSLFLRLITLELQASLIPCYMEDT